MKTLFYTALVLAIIAGCTSNKTISGSAAPDKAVVQNDTVRIANDSLQYEVIIIDPGFNGWLASRAYPRNYYSQTYLESKNRIWVNEWNLRANSPRSYKDLYEWRIDYDPFTDYGYEVNYLLYNYLVYFQNKYDQRLGGNVPVR